MGNYDWPQIIRKIVPHGNTNIIKSLAAAMPEVIRIADLTSERRLSNFLAQIAHESAGFTTTEEFASGERYERRKDLGNTQPGDGKRFKGRGLIQLTGRHNYKIYSEKFGVDFISSPGLAAKFPWAALTAAMYWRDRGLNRYADRDDIKAVTRHINGGYNGLADREQYLLRAKRVLIEAPRSDEGIDVAAMQRRLTDLNYAAGGVDGNIGPLTRSAIRDFQDANNLVINGKLDAATVALLNNPDVPPRPVPPERAALTAEDLRQGGSKVIQGADEAKFGAVGAGLATAAAAAGDASTVVNSVKEITAGASAGVSWKELAETYWPVFVIIASIVAVTYFAWVAYRGAKKVEEERVDNARKGLNVRL